jgi:hypothetical protein
MFPAGADLYRKIAKGQRREDPAARLNQALRQGKFGSISLAKVRRVASHMRKRMQAPRLELDERRGEQAPGASYWDSAGSASGKGRSPNCGTALAMSIMLGIAKSTGLRGGLAPPKHWQGQASHVWVSMPTPSKIERDHCAYLSDVRRFVSKHCSGPNVTRFVTKLPSLKWRCGVRRSAQAPVLSARLR